MTKKVLPVRIVLKEGPVIIRSLNGAGISAEYDLLEDKTWAGSTSLHDLGYKLIL